MGGRRIALAKRRAGVGLTQERLAANLCMDVSAVKRWELGTSTPGPSVRPALANALQVSLENLTKLLGGTAPTSTGIVGLSSKKKTRISDYKECLLEATGDIFISGTSLLHISEDSFDILSEKKLRNHIRILVMDPDWIEKNYHILTFFCTERAKKRFRYEIDLSIDRLSPLVDSRFQLRGYSTVFPYIMTGYRSTQSRVVVEITDYIPTEERPRFQVVPSSSGEGLYEMVLSKFNELWNSHFVREVL